MHSNREGTTIERSVEVFRGSRPDEKPWRVPRESATLLPDSAVALYGTCHCAPPPEAVWLGILVFIRKHSTDLRNSRYHVFVF